MAATTASASIIDLTNPILNVGFDDLPKSWQTGWMPAKHYPQKPAWYDNLTSLDEDDGALVLRQGVIAGHRTSFRLDNLTWKALADVAEREGLTLNELYTRIAQEAPKGLNFTAALRRYLLAYFRKAAADRRPAKAGQGVTSNA
jgi:predicted DNA-binding ribbon-helix-helix protein